MNFEEVYNHLKKRCHGLNALFSFDKKLLKRMKFYHVVIHKLALVNFDINLFNIKVSKLWRNEHLHLIVHSIDELENSEGIRSYRIDLSDLHYIDDHFITCSEKEHDYFCSVSFGITSLKNMCIISVLKNLDYLHNMKRLKLPKCILKDIFQQSKFGFSLPEFSGQSRVTNWKMYEIFTKQDIVFHKKDVFLIQNEHSLELYRYIGRSVIVFFDFNVTDNDSIKMCLECMKFENENGYYQRRYKLLQFYFHSYNEMFVKDPINWCHVCRQVPLFQILTYDQFNSLYKYDMYEDNTDEPVIKIDYFEKGDKVKSLYVSSKTIFGGPYHPYIK